MTYIRGRKTLFVSVMVMVFIVTLVSSAFMLAIFRQDITNEYAILQSIANTESRFVSNLLQKHGIKPDKKNHLLQELLNQDKNFLTFATTGDTIIAKKTDETFKFIWSARSGDITSANLSTLDDLYTNGILRIFIFGESPIFIGSDYTGKTVLSTCVPISDSNMFLITKIDLDEILMPFSKIIIKYLFFEFILLAIGTLVIVLAYTKSLNETIKRTIHDLSRSRQIIKDLQEIEKSLEHMKDKMEDALEVGLFGFWSYDFKNGTSNRSLRHDQIFGYTTLVENWNFQTFLDHIVEEDKADVKKHFDESMTSDQEIDIACRITRCDGEERWLWVRGKFREKNGSLIGIIRDITTRKNTEKELTEYRERLEELVEARTAELQTEKEKLQTALSNIKTLKTLLPICSGCKKVRDDDGYWSQVETYISKHTDTEFSHSLCPDCLAKLYPEIANSISEKEKTNT